MGKYQMTTKRGYDFFECSSAFQKAIRRNDYKVAGYFGHELIASGFTMYVWKRLLTISAEDCFGLITKEIKSLYDSWDIVNKGQSKKIKGRVFLGKAIIILCTAWKSREADHLQCLVYDKMKGITDDEVKSFLREASDPEKRHQVPEYTYDCHTLKGKISGATKEQFFKDEQNALHPKQKGLFDELIH